MYTYRDPSGAGARTKDRSNERIPWEGSIKYDKRSQHMMHIEKKQSPTHTQ